MRNAETNDIKRVVWIDLLRIVATWGVISIHGKPWYILEVGSVRWFESRIIGLAFTFCVPAFLMLSGMLSLSKPVTINYTLKRRVSKMVLMKVLSIVLCSIAGGMRALVLQNSVREGILNAVEAWGFGTSYLVVLAGCYLVTPFLYKIVEDDKLEKYFLILAMFFCWLIPSIVDLDYVRAAMPNVAVSVASWIDSAQIYIPVGSTMLYVLGHYIGKVSHRISKKSATVLLLISGLLWIAGNINNELYPETISIFDVMRYGRYYGGYVSPIITFYAASVVIFFKVVIEDIYIGDNLAKIINHLGRNSAMIFLLHGIVIIIFPDIIPVHKIESYLVETIVNVTFYFIVCYILGMVLKIIPLIKRIVE